MLMFKCSRRLSLKCLFYVGWCGVKTVSQVAREYGISEQGLYKRIKRLSTELSPWLSRGENGITVVSPEGERILTKGLTVVDSGRQPISEEVDNRRQPETTSRQLTDSVSDGTVNALISMLQCELNLKNKQIEDLTMANKDLTAALVAAQQTAAAAQALHAGTMRTQLLADGGGKEGVAHQVGNDVTETKKMGLLKRIFKRIFNNK